MFHFVRVHGPVESGAVGRDRRGVLGGHRRRLLDGIEADDIPFRGPRRVGRHHPEVIRHPGSQAGQRSGDRLYREVGYRWPGQGLKWEKSGYYRSRTRSGHRLPARSGSRYR